MAKGGPCHCCCGGKNHGIGVEQAAKNISDYCNEMITDWKKTHPEDHFILEPLLF